MIDYKIINKSIAILKKNTKKYDIITNVFPRSFPKGQSVEIINTKILENNINNFNSYEKEHVTQYFYKYSNKFFIKNFSLKKNSKIIKLSVDTRSDLNRITMKFKKKKFENFSIYK